MRWSSSLLVAAIVGWVGLAVVSAEEKQNDAGPQLFELFDATAESAPAAEAAPATARPLGEAETQRLLARLPVPAPEASVATPVASLPPGPPPRNVRSVAGDFTAAEGPPPQPAAAALHIVRRSPEGEVGIAPNLTVAFSQPMVPLASDGALAREAVPVRLAPQPPGCWRWLDTRTLLFEPTVRFPMATDYAVEVPEGTRSLAGNVLEETVHWTFSTPAPRVVTWSPTGMRIARQPLILVGFDQRIDPRAVMAFLRVHADSQPCPVREARVDEIEEHEAFRGLTRSAGEDRWIAVRPVEPLAPLARVQLEIEAGLGSAEGPRTTSSSQTSEFRVHDALKLIGEDTQNRAGWANLLFTNPLDVKAFDPSCVRVRPAVDDLKPSISHDRIVLGGRPRPDRTYRIRVCETLRDVFGQSLGHEVSLSVTTPKALRVSGVWLARAPLVVADPAHPSLSVFSRGLRAFRLRAYAVETSAWAAFWKAYGGWQEPERELASLGRVTLDEVIRVPRAGGATVENRIDLSAALGGAHGHLIVIVEAIGEDRAGPRFSPALARAARIPTWRDVAWVQATHIGVEVTVDADGLLVWAASLLDGRPLAGVEVELLPAGAKAVTDASGLARVELGQTPTEAVIARTADDVAVLPPSDSWRRWTRDTYAAADRLRWYVADDRGLYRPGEKMRLKGYLRGRDRRGALRPLDAGAATTIDYVLQDAGRDELLKGHAEVNRFGAFDLALELPAVMTLGRARILLEARPGYEGARTHEHAFEVQEFRRPEFELTQRLSAETIVAGEDVQATVAATYYSGGALPGAKTRWDVAVDGRTSVPIRLPAWEDFGFDADLPLPTHEGRLVGSTNPQGEHTLRIVTRDVRARAAHLMSLRASIEDLNGQGWFTNSAFVVLPARALVGLKSERRLVPPGRPIEVDVIVVDPDGKALVGRPVSLRAERLDWRQVHGEWQWVTVHAQERRLTSIANATRCAFTPEGGGQHRLTAIVADDQGREHLSEITVWVAGKGFAGTVRGREAVSLTPDKEEYRPGEVAQLLVSSPFAPAQGLLTLRRGGVVSTQIFEMTERTLTLAVPIDEDWMPNVTAHVELLAPDLRAGAEPAPAHPLSVAPQVASADAHLTISRQPRRLEIVITPRQAELAPGGETTVDLLVRDAAGQPVGEAEVAVWAVDESVLALLPRDLEHPNDVLHPAEHSWASDDRLVDRLDLASREVLSRIEALLGRRGALLVSRKAPGAGPRWSGLQSASGAREGRLSPESSLIEPRGDFSPLAFFVPSIVTATDGRASVTVRVPDNLTRYRLFALATDGGLRFGLGGGATLTARLPLMARPSPPRFLNRGDVFELPVVVQNDSAAALEVNVAVRPNNLRLTGNAGQAVTVPAHGRAAVRFPAVADRAGEAGVAVIASSGELHDSATLKLPVKVPVRLEQMAVYGQIDRNEAVRQVVEAPADALPDVGGIDVSLSSTELQGLSDAVLDLATYEFECAEQISSRVLGIAALRDVLTALQAPGLPSAEQLTARVRADVQRLATLQNTDGGFGFWRRGAPSWPYVTIHVTHALARARQKGFAVPTSVLERAQKYLARVDDEIPKDHPAAVRPTLKAYALHVRHLLGEPVGADARELLQSVGLERLSLETLGWLLPVLASDSESVMAVRAIRRHLNNRVTETAGQAHFVVEYQDGAHLLLYSDRRADAVLLDGLVAAEPGSDLIPKLAAGLQARRRRGPWSNTQESVFVLLALDRYFQTFEKASPDFAARLWWGPRPGGESRFTGHSTKSESFSLPMARLQGESGASAVTLAKEGTGRLYYRVGLRHASARIDRPPADHGFGVTRTYGAVDDPQDVRREPDGRWRLRAGARVRVRVTLVAPSVRHHVALVDPLPAGLEPLNTLLALSGGDPDRDDDDDEEEDEAANERPTRTGSWVEHQNLRDDRAEAFAATLPAGVYEFEYLARATTKGRFVAPAPRAEEMYAPETYGRGAVDLVVVE